MRRLSRALVVALLGLLLVTLAACDSTGLSSVPTAAPAAPTLQATSASGNDLEIDPNATISGDSKPVPVGSDAPDFSLPGIDGKTYTLSDQKGKPVVLEFIATWCPHCQDDAPTMNKLDAAYKDRGVQLFAINATPRGHNNAGRARMSDLQWFHDTYSVTFPLLFDRELKTTNDYGIQFYPAIYIVDQHGKVTFQPPDNQRPTYDLISDEIDRLLKK